MNTNQRPEDFPEIQAAIYRVALSLDSVLINGIPIGVIQRDVCTGFLEKTATTLMTELTLLEEQARHTIPTSQAKASALLTGLRAKCQQLLDLVSELISFRTLPLEQLRSTVSRILLLREACVHQIQELETCFRTPRPFYPSKPAYLTAAMNDFLANLESLLTQERSAAAPA
ncbi:MAG TPA: hypothetical protein VMG10_22870 [Gemmataceae bacterium]|nr:hypothetical protein [Gemmataceae bacterium]